MDAVDELMAAVSAGDASKVRAMLEADRRLAGAYSDEGWAMLHLAATPEVAGLLLDAGADINASNRHLVFGPEGKPLHAAVYQNRPDVVELLLRRGAGVNATDRAGWTALHMAVANGRIELARMLLDAGADATRRIGEVAGQGWSGKTPLELLDVPDRTGEGAAELPAETDAALRRLLTEWQAAH